MTSDEIIDAQLALYAAIVKAYKTKFGQDPAVSIAGIIYEQTNDWLLSEKISRDRAAAREEHESKPLSDQKCRDCGRVLTVGEKEFCDKNDKPYRCYQCSKKSK